MHGHVDRVTRNYIVGWAAHANSPEREVQLSVVVNGRQNGRTTANHQNDNLRKVFPGATGKYAFRFDFDPPLSLFVTQQVEIVATDTGERLPNGLHVIRAICTREGADTPSAENPKALTPIIVTSAGRSGSSLFMARLRSHPKIIVAGDHPYEVMLLSYYALAFRTLVSQADRKRSTNPETMLAVQHRFHTGFNPFNDDVFGRHARLLDYWNDSVPRSLAQSFGHLISDYYKVVQELTSKNDPIFFAEKAQPNADIGKTSQVMFGPTREIVLIRDPRDLLCSMKSFWKSDTNSAIGSIRSQMEYIRRHRDLSPDNTLFIKYESLVLHADDTMRRVYSFLDVSNAVANESDSEGAFSQHGTSASPSQSVGRWQRDLSAEEIEISRIQFRSILEAFEYEP